MGSSMKRKQMVAPWWMDFCGLDGLVIDCMVDHTVQLCSSCVRRSNTVL